VAGGDSDVVEVDAGVERAADEGVAEHGSVSRTCPLSLFVDENLTWTSSPHPASVGGQ